MVLFQGLGSINGDLELRLSWSVLRSVKVLRNSVLNPECLKPFFLDPILNSVSNLVVKSCLGSFQESCLEPFHALCLQFCRETLSQSFSGYCLEAFLELCLEFFRCSWNLSLELFWTLPWICLEPYCEHSLGPVGKHCLKPFVDTVLSLFLILPWYLFWSLFSILLGNHV